MYLGRVCDTIGHGGEGVLLGSKMLDAFHIVALTSEENEDINSAKDLSGKTFMAVKKSSFGGWQMAYMELLGQDIDPFKDFSKLEFGGKHDNVVLAVQNGAVDAGTVRTDTLERMAATGMIEMSEFKIISSKTWRFSICTQYSTLS